MEQVDFVPLIVGGGDTDGTYRGDSFVCAAALQAYVQSNLAPPRVALNISTLLVVLLATPEVAALPSSSLATSQITYRSLRMA